MQRTESELKYRLRVFARNYLKSISEKKFTIQLGIPWSTYQKDKFILKSDSFSMPESRLLRYAKAYGVGMEDLINYKIDQKCLLQDSYQEELSVLMISKKLGMSL